MENSVIKLKDQVIEYNITDTKIAELKAKYKGLKAADAKQYKGITTAIADVRDTRIGVDKRRKELKSDANDYKKRVDVLAEEIIEKLVAIEEPLKAEKEAYDAEKERIKKEKERMEQERINNIQTVINRHREKGRDLHNKTMEQLQANYDDIESYIKADLFNYFEFKQEAEQVKAEALEILEAAIIERQEKIAKDKEEAERAAALEEETEY